VPARERVLPSWNFSKISIFPQQLSFGPLRLQAKLAIGAVNDPLEQEADRIANQLMRMPAPELSIASAPAQISRKCAACEEEDKKKLQMKPAGTPHATGPEAPPIVHEVLRSRGQPLDAATREFFEPRFGHDFSRVRIHTGSQAELSARAVNSSAYTIGSNIVFAAQRYAPSTYDGARLLAHELTHVLQQQGTGQPTNSAEWKIPGTQLQRQDDGTGSMAEAAPSEPITPETTEPALAELEGPPESATPQSSGPGPSGGKPDPSLPDCTAVMGGRQVDYWAAKIIGAQHTFMNFKLDSSNYWLFEGGPLPSDPKKTGAWAKLGDWDTRGPRVTKTFGKEDCTAIKDCLLDTTAKYHAAGVSYDPTDGPNSNSFMEQLTFKCKDLPRSFITRDIQWYYWDKPGKGGKIHTRPF
jgi:hypothetical protein